MIIMIALIVVVVAVGGVVRGGGGGEVRNTCRSHLKVMYLKIIEYDVQDSSYSMILYVG